MSESSYVYIWEFQVPAVAEGAFVRHYGPEGDWVKLFQQSAGYRDTQLYKDREYRGRYLTIDRWSSESAFREFRRRYAREFEELDRRCEQLTTRESALGAFTDVQLGEVP